MNEVSKEENESLQADEIQALSSIYGDEWKIDNCTTSKECSIDISNDSTNKVHLQVFMPDCYPLHGPPIYQISAPWMSRFAKNSLSLELEEIYGSHVGESIIYMWIENIRDFIIRNKESSHINNVSTVECSEVSDEPPFESSSIVKELQQLPPIKHGEPIVDRRSTFQAHLAPVVTEDQVKQVLDHLKENRKIATATHNIFAYRISRESQGTYLHDYDDDGETRAGSILAHLLQILDARDVLVVVSRWYGGIRLGPDRFKHINNAARILLCESGYAKVERLKRPPTKDVMEK